MDLQSSTNVLAIKESGENSYTNTNVPEIRVGDTVRMGVLITEGNKERVQFAEGVIIAKGNSGTSATITVRRDRTRSWRGKSISY